MNPTPTNTPFWLERNEKSFRKSSTTTEISQTQMKLNNANTRCLKIYKIVFRKWAWVYKSAQNVEVYSLVITRSLAPPVVGLPDSDGRYCFVAGFLHKRREKRTWFFALLVTLSRPLCDATRPLCYITRTSFERCVRREDYEPWRMFGHDTEPVITRS